MPITIQNKTQKVRFIAVGGINTVVDFGVLFALETLGLPAVVANLFSTTCAFSFSFFANRKYTFKTTSTNLKRELALFVSLTLFGLWGLQTVIIALITGTLSHSGLANSLVLLAAKILASTVSLTWNYLVYSRIVFKQPLVPPL